MKEQCLVWTRLAMESGNLSWLPKSTRSTQSAAEMSWPVADLEARTQVMRTCLLMATQLVADLCQNCWPLAEKVLKWSTTCTVESYSCLGRQLAGLGIRSFTAWTMNLIHRGYACQISYHERSPTTPLIHASCCPLVHFFSTLAHDSSRTRLLLSLSWTVSTWGCVVVFLATTWMQH